MDGDGIIISVTYCGKTKLISVNSFSVIESISSQITDEWVEVGKGKFRNSCVVGDVSDILIESQDDFASLLLMCNVSSVRVVIATLMVDKVMNGDQLQSNLVGLENRVDNYGERFSNCNPCEMESISEFVSAPVNVVISNSLSSLLSSDWVDLLNSGAGTYYPGSAAEFKKVLIKYCSKIGVRINYVRNSPYYIHVVCFYNLNEGCNWFLKAKFLEDKQCFYICSADVVHTCSCQDLRKPSSEMLKPRFKAELLLLNVQNNSKMCAKDVVDAMKVGYGFDIPYWKANRAAVIARGLVFGTHVDSYDRMFHYCKALQLTNPGSSVVFEQDPVSNNFERVFIALRASIEGFKCCIPMLFVDGTFLRGQSKGILLVAIAKDGNRGLFPFAFALVSSETTENWAWFLANVKNCVQHNRKVYYLSDRNAGLLAAVPLVFQEFVHFFCVFHLLQNLKTRFSGGLTKKKRARYHSLFKECAYELDGDVFEAKIAKFRLIGGKKAYVFLSQLPSEKWAIAYAPIMSPFGEMTSNAAECYNDWLLMARSLPLTKLFDSIRSGLCRWFVQCYSASSRFDGVLVPRRQKDWNRMAAVGLKWNIIMCPGGVFEVQCNPSVCVDLRARSCSCGVWQAVGFPCVHGVVVIRKERLSVLDDVESYYLASTYRQCYSGIINPVCEMLVNEIQQKSIQPKIGLPNLFNPVGRPKSKKRMMSYIEVSKSKVKIGECMKCGVDDNHDAWTCSKASVGIDLNMPPEED